MRVRTRRCTRPCGLSALCVRVPLAVAAGVPARAVGGGAGGGREGGVRDGAAAGAARVWQAPSRREQGDAARGGRRATRHTPCRTHAPRRAR
eukprot:6364757-Prymnesium_polylepis.1